jgi:hypothetical protein
LIILISFYLGERFYDDNGNCYVATSKNDFRGWEFLGKEKYKKGVYKVMVRLVTKSPAEFRMVFTKTEHLPTVKKGVCL